MLAFSCFITVVTKPTFSFQELGTGFWKYFQTGSRRLQLTALSLLKASSEQGDSLKHKPLLSPLTYQRINTFTQLWLQHAKPPWSVFMACRYNDKQVIYLQILSARTTVSKENTQLCPKISLLLTKLWKTN